ncbi:MAG: hypothetical protein JWR80_2807 [Bradyrhizobium sp.]|nr:hypothetical protein [Bradyrhizobium sp.]
MITEQNLARQDVRLILKASRDRVTGGGVFPRIPDQAPSASRFEPITLSPVATLYSYTIVHPNPKTGEKPFALIYADFPEQVRVFGRLELPAGDRPKIGMALTVVSADPTRSAADDGDAYLFIPATEHAA